MHPYVNPYRTNGEVRQALPFAAAGRRPSFVDILLAPITEPYAQDLGDFLFFSFREGVVELERARSFRAACVIPVGVPVAARQANAATDFLAQGFATQACRIDALLHIRTIHFQAP
jgi:hypothetical protein